MAKVKNLDTSIKATIISNKCHITCACVDDKDTSINATIVSPTTEATTTKKGIVRLATEQEAKEGERQDNVVITPYTLRQSTHYTHEQGIASEIWVINHNLNKEPSVVAVDTADEEQVPDKKVYNNKNQVTLYFLSEVAGKAYLN